MVICWNTQLQFIRRIVELSMSKMKEWMLFPKLLISRLSLWQVCPNFVNIFVIQLIKHCAKGQTAKQWFLIKNRKDQMSLFSLHRKMLWIIFLGSNRDSQPKKLWKSNFYDEMEKNIANRFSFPKVFPEMVIIRKKQRGIVAGIRVLHQESRVF